MIPHSFEILSTVLFATAVIHIFFVSRFRRAAVRFPDGSVGANFFDLLGEVEVVFGLWAGILVIAMGFGLGFAVTARYVESLNFKEPFFVFVIMTVAATRPVVRFAAGTIARVARIVPAPPAIALYFSCLTVGPLLGSLITEPGAMTVTALVLKDRFFDRGLSPIVAYLTVGVLFVNVSVGGVLTHFAAPPVLMVAETWRWDTAYMMSHFGWKACVAVIGNALFATLVAAAHSRRLAPENKPPSPRLPFWLTALHLGTLLVIILTAHHPIFFLGTFLFFLGATKVTQRYREELRLEESLLVGCFLAGLVVLGAPQRWWLAPLVTQLAPFTTFAGATFLTAFTDNAALTYLGSQIPELNEALRYALVAGAVTGGGLTVIANAPNPAGYAILRESFGAAGLKPLPLAAAAIVPTLIAAICFWGLP